MAGKAKAPPQKDEDRALRLILEGTARETGEAFFRALVRNLAEALDTPIAWVTEWVPDGRKLRSTSDWDSAASASFKPAPRPR